jgi:hypothetical protein
MDHLLTRNVFIDTQAFVQARFDWRGRELGKILELGSARKIRLLTTNVTRREVYAHIEQRLGEAGEALRKHAALLGQSGIPLDGLLQTKTPATAAHAAFDDYLAKAHAFDIKVRADIDKLLDDYFARRPPFGELTKRKFEFPDAIVGASLLAWCETSNSQVYVVTADAGFQSFCEAHSDRLIHLPGLSAFLSRAVTTEEILQSVASQLKTSTQLSQLLSQQMREATASTREGHPGTMFRAQGKVAKINGIEVKDVDIVDTHDARFDCHIEFLADLTLDLTVEDWSSSSSSEPDMFRAQYKVTDRLTAFASVEFDPETRKLCDISSVMVPANHIVLDPDDVRRRV